MNEKRSGEIICSACGAEALLVRAPKYDGFTKVGECITCSACGHEYASEEDVTFKETAVPAVFTEADKSDDPVVFDEDEADRLCRYCESYVLNPFMQWCSVRKKEVESTDTCDRFSRKPDPVAEEE